MTLFPSPTRRCLLPSFLFHARWKSQPSFGFEEQRLWRLIVDMKVFVALFFSLVESFAPFVMKADISHLHLCGPDFVCVYHKDRKMQLRLATPPYNILGSSGNFPGEDAFPWSLQRSVTSASSETAQVDQNMTNQQVLLR